MNDSQRIDSNFCTTKSLTNEAFIDSLVDLLSSYKDVFCIDGFTLSQAERPRYKPLEHERIRHLFLVEKERHIRFGGNKGVRFQLVMLVDEDAGKLLRNTYVKSHFFIHINDQFFEANDGTVNYQNIEKYLDFTRALNQIIDPLCGEICDSKDDHAVRLSLDGGGLFRFMGFFSMRYGRVEHPHIDCPVTGVSWANFFGAGCVRYWGRDKLLKATGVYRAEELSNGGILLLTAPHPLTPDDPEHRANQIALWKHLGLSPAPNLKRIAKYKSTDCWKGAPFTLKMNGPWTWSIAREIRNIIMRLTRRKT